jgi:hypothetical protein
MSPSLETNQATFTSAYIHHQDDLQVALAIRPVTTTTYCNTSGFGSHAQPPPPCGIRTQMMLNNEMAMQEEMRMERIPDIGIRNNNDEIILYKEDRIDRMLAN